MKASFQYMSRRSPVLGAQCCVSSDVPIASKIGLDILQAGGNAADAAVGMTAALGVVDPMSSGIGGDCFCLFYRAHDQNVLGINGNGRSPAKFTLNMVNSVINDDNLLPSNHGLTVVVPGAVGGWIDTLSNFGSDKLSLKDILTPAINLAKEGFPVTSLVAEYWKQNEYKLKQSRFGKYLLQNDEAPKAGDIMKYPLLGTVLEQIASHGKEGFYTGYVANKIASEVQYAGGCLTEDDLQNHIKEPKPVVQPISTDFYGIRLWETPPVSQGLVALLSLNILEEFDLKAKGHNSAEYLHILAECFRLAHLDGHKYIADNKATELALHQLLNKNYAKERRSFIHFNKVMPKMSHGELAGCNSDTTYLSVLDKNGNACSFIASIYKKFGSGIVPEGCGFVLNNRGLNFSLKPKHYNAFGPSKLPYNTIIPAMLTDIKNNSLLASYGVMGGFMQPQGHVQVLLNMLLFGMDPQTALDQPRLFVETVYKQETPYVIHLEDGINKTVKTTLESWGHIVNGPVCNSDREIFGRGHVITRGSWWSKWDEKLSHNTSDNVLWAGSDPRSDGIALGY